ncbi:hypothetical protein Sjap_012079 [Stephania japonica]|uniref:Uncharacterized protein n=1 Tax=Stephania japonica TaxID=461633 RepID=A0AAP0IX99_9MAGN
MRRQMTHKGSCPSVGKVKTQGQNGHFVLKHKYKNKQTLIHYSLSSPLNSDYTVHRPPSPLAPPRLSRRHELRRGELHLSFSPISFVLSLSLTFSLSASHSHSRSGCFRPLRLDHHHRHPLRPPTSPPPPENTKVTVPLSLSLSTRFVLLYPPFSLMFIWIVGTV